MYRCSSLKVLDTSNPGMTEAVHSSVGQVQVKLGGRENVEIKVIHAIWCISRKSLALIFNNEPKNTVKIECFKR